MDTYTNLSKNAIKKLTDAKNSIGETLVWHNTKQGSEYWNAVFNNMEDLIENGYPDKLNE